MCPAARGPSVPQACTSGASEMSGVTHQPPGSPGSVLYAEVSLLQPRPPGFALRVINLSHVTKTNAAEGPGVYEVDAWLVGNSLALFARGVNILRLRQSRESLCTLPGALCHPVGRSSVKRRM